MFDSIPAAAGPAVQTATKTKTEVANVLMMGLMLSTATVLMGLYASYAAISMSLSASSEPKAAFSYESFTFIAFGEYGTMYDLGSSWKHVDFIGIYTEPPVVIAKPVDYTDPDQAHARLRNITTTGFDVKIEEWAYQNGAHGKSQVNFMALIPNKPVKWGGFRIEAGTKDNAGRWKKVFFTPGPPGFFGINADVAFDVPPVVISQVQTSNSGVPVVTRNTLVTKDTFKTKIQAEEGSPIDLPNETIGFIAMAPFTGAYFTRQIEAGFINSVNHNWKTKTFGQDYVDPPVFIADMQTTNGGDTAGLRYRNLDADSVDVFVEEEQAKNAEVRHAVETIGYIAIAKPRPPKAVLKVSSVTTVAHGLEETVVRGIENNRFGGLVLDASESETPIQITQLLFKLRAFTVSTSPTSTNATYLQNLNNFKIFDGNFEIVTGNDPDVSVASTTAEDGTAIATFNFAGSETPAGAAFLTVGAGQIRTLYLHADISSETPADGSFKVGPSVELGESVVSAKTLLCPTCTVDVDVVHSNGPLTSVFMRGELLMDELNVVGPGPLPEDTDQLFIGDARFTAAHEDIIVKYLSFSYYPPLNGTRGQQISLVEYYDGPNLIQRGSTVTLNDPIIVAKDSSKIITVKIYTRRLGQIVGGSGGGPVLHDEFISNLWGGADGLVSGERVTNTTRADFGPFILNNDSDLVCGDGIIVPGESCDDGNLNGGDGCSPTCQLEGCGNGVIEPGEICDGNVGNAAQEPCESNFCQLDCTCRP